MNPRRQKRLLVITSIIAAVALATGLVLYALSQNIDLFYTPTEIVEGKGAELKKPEIGQRLRVGGFVVPGTVERPQGSLHVEFHLIDESSDATVVVRYEGVLPDLFREGQGIVAQGILSGPNTVEASEVLAKHDEDYLPPALAKEVKGVKHQKPSMRGDRP